ncbi:MAG: DEAD/DEAH box helicase [Deltaproteobacteria bacterium]|nr:DEAD/DEAH box helicase [Deltaproteobacteria bacterium]MCX7952459.1 DEAD/DEAH box helicase [Deltaproteobacteria bacterium]
MTKRWSRKFRRQSKSLMKYQSASYGLETKDIKEARREFFRGIGKPEMTEFKPDPFQLQAIDSVLNCMDTLVVAPTGSGKTYIAISVINIFLSMGISCIYTTPLKALSNTKYVEFREQFKNYRVGILTGDRKIDTDGDLIVATTEIFRNETLRHSASWGLVVIDEAHYLSDPQRGVVWEESIILCPKDSTLLLLSATIGNPNVFRDWISFAREKPCALVLETRRPVELRFGVLEKGAGILPLSVFDKSKKNPCKS